jgi:predicted nucleic acid-binding protein
MAGTVLLDTNVFSSRLALRSPLPALYDRHLVGRRIAVAAQTVAEVRFGVLAAGWGERPAAQVERLVHRSLVLPPDDETVWAFARLRADARRLGHALQQKEHVGDLWIAATAIRWALPLVAHDAVFIGCPGLNLITELQTG